MAGLTEEDVRRIIREELKSLLESLEVSATSSLSYAGDLESAACRAIENVVRSEAERMPHDWKCATRIGCWPNDTCDCGIDRKEENDD